VSNQLDLLRMLEPTVRPDGVAGRAPGARAPQQPIEGRDFASLLQEAQHTPATQPSVQAASETTASAPTNPLARLNDIPNPAVHRIIHAAQDNPKPS